MQLVHIGDWGILSLTCLDLWKKSASVKVGEISWFQLIADHVLSCALSYFLSLILLISLLNQGHGLSLFNRASAVISRYCRTKTNKVWCVLQISAVSAFSDLADIFINNLSLLCWLKGCFMLCWKCIFCCKLVVCDLFLWERAEKGGSRCI